MARPVEFNREDVVQKSLVVFRRKGYNGTSMRDLEAATGLNPGSFYAAFGNKHHFFLETLRYFYQQVQLSLQSILSEEPNTIVGLRVFFDKVVECAVSSEKAERCCYVIKAALELAPIDEQVSQLVNSHFAEMENAIYEALVLAQQAGLIANHDDIAVMSKLLINTLYGVNVESMLNPEKHKLQQMVALLFASLFQQPPNTMANAG